MRQCIHMISGPRNISTAMMYAFGNRTDFEVVDEPFYAYYLSKFDIDHPGRQEILDTQSTDHSMVIDSLFHKARNSPYLFIKNMAHHLDGFDYSFIYKCKNIFLIRDPRLLINSFAKVIPKPHADQLGIRREYEIFKEIEESVDHQSIVIDSGELLKNPQKIISVLCDRLDIPYDEAMLSWAAGPREEDGVWARYWYKKVHQSTGFVRQESSSTQLSEELLPIYNQVKDHYYYLFDKALKA